MTRRVAILGSTGSIGTQALDVIARYPDRFKVVGLAAGRNVDLLREQAKTFAPEIATTADDGADGLMRVATMCNPDVVLAATDGAVAFDAVFEAVRRGTDIAVANKELIVAAGDLFTAEAEKSGARILPVDSEHSAIFQCLVGEDHRSIAQIVLTASGGPFWRKSKSEIAAATLKEALAHPTWQMGTKNTIDSATMMNKGLEIIEASRLFHVDADRLKIVVHPQSIAHGFVEFTDGSIKGQLCAPDMRIPIGYALAYPDRLCHPEVLAKGEPRRALLGTLDFEEPDIDRFPCVRLAYAALRQGGTAPAALSAANEVAVHAFVEGKIGFTGIARVIEYVLGVVELRESTLETIRAADREARIAADNSIKDVSCSVSSQ